MIEIDNIKSNSALIRQKAINIRNTSTGQNKTRAIAIITLLDKINADMLLVEDYIARNTLTPEQIEEVLRPRINRIKGIK